MMKILKSMKWLSAAGSVVIAGLCLAPQVQAATGICTPVGGPKAYNFNFNPTLTEPGQNVAGMIIEDAAGDAWNGSAKYTVQCDCPLVTEMDANYVTATSPLPELGALPNGNGAIYYELNQYLAVAAEVYISGWAMKYVRVPFSNVSNENDNAGIPCTYDFTSGSKGKIHLYFRRPFVGVSEIPLTKLVDVYLSSIDGVSSPTPSAQVYMSGTVTVPQNCEISPSPVDVDLGTILSGDMKTAGAMPKNYTKVNKKLTLGCRNISEGVVINLSFQATPDPTFSDAFKTDNDDIAVKIEDKNGKIIEPNNGRLDVDLNYDTQKGHTEMNLYPINTSGKLPEVGTFNSTATIKVEIQ